MNEDLIKKLRGIAEVIGGDFGDILSQSAVALEAKAAPVGEREAFEQAWMDYSFVDMRQCAEYFYQARAAYQRTQQPSAGVVMQKLIEDADTFGPSLNAAGWEFIDTCPEKSALLFNTCKTALRVAILKYLELEFARLNGKEVV